MQRPLRFLGALLAGLLVSAAPALAQEEGPICGWFNVPGELNTGLLFPGEAPPWIDPTAPCSCCPGGKFGLAVFNNPPGSPALVFLSLGTGSFPLLGQTFMLNPLQLIGDPITLSPAPEDPTFAQICWEVDNCVPIPDDAGLIGLRVYMQAVSISALPPNETILSNRLELLIGTLF